MNSSINFRIAFKVLSNNLLIIGISLFACLGIAFFYSEAPQPFIWSSLLTFSLGILLHFTTKKKDENEKIHKKDAYLTVTLSWLGIALAGSLPYLFSGTIPGFTDAFFESISGFTTTGSSILTDIEILPKSILFWRSLTHWIGGIGIIVLVIVVMPTLHIGGYHLFTLESSLQEKIQPKIKSVGNRLLLIYLILTFAEIVLLMAGGMDLFESSCHAFGTVATGGFSPKNDSVAGYSPYIQYVIMIFMLLAGVNFVIHYYLYKREFKKVKENEEVKFYLTVVAVLGLILTFALFFKMNKPFEESFREAFFQVISIITCTGFATADYLLWPSFAWTILFLAMFLGGSTGSTAGGIKMARHLVLLKNLRKMVRQIISPKAILLIKLNKQSISDESNNSILTFITVYLIIFVFGSVLLSLTGVDGESSASAVATCMAGIGPGLGTVGPVSNFAHIPISGKWILSLMMLLGRLEIYTLIALFTPDFWKK